MEKRKTTRTRKHVPATPAAASALLTDEPPLSARLAFVVQFRQGAGQAGYFAGRVEHMATYQATRFGSEAELVAFLRRVLRAEDAGTER
ncbi:MAG: hypothetical protein ACRERD_09440 [Candidatus Binatia bacterium]